MRIRAASSVVATAQAFAAAAASSVAELNNRKRWRRFAGLVACPGFMFVQVRDAGRSRPRRTWWRLAFDIRSLLNWRCDAVFFDLLRSGTVFVSEPVIDGGKEVGRINLISRYRRSLAGLLSIAMVDPACVCRGAVIGLSSLGGFSGRSPIHYVICWVLWMRSAGTIATMCVSKKPSDQEIGRLVDGFNAMLGDIRDRDQRLAASPGDSRAEGRRPYTRTGVARGRRRDGKPRQI